MEYICTYKGHKLYYAGCGYVMVFDEDDEFEFAADTFEEAKEDIDT